MVLSLEYCQEVSFSLRSSVEDTPTTIIGEDIGGGIGQRHTSRHTTNVRSYNAHTRVRACVFSFLGGFVTRFFKNGQDIMTVIRGNKDFLCRSSSDLFQVLSHTQLLCTLSHKFES